MKEFMMIFTGPDYQSLQLSPEEVEKRMQKWNDWVADLQSKNLYISGNALLPHVTRVAGQEQVKTDGPFMEAKELVGGYFVIKASDIQHAISLTNGFPDYDLEGGVEVREVMIFDK